MPEEEAAEKQDASRNAKNIAALLILEQPQASGTREAQLEQASAAGTPEGLLERAKCLPPYSKMCELCELCELFVKKLLSKTECAILTDCALFM